MRDARTKEENDIRSVILEKLYANDLHKHIGLEMLELSPTYAKARIKTDKKLDNVYGSIHGGILLTLADIVAGATACMSGYYASTVSAGLNFLLPAADTEYIYCECMKLKTGKHILVFDLRITDDNGNLLDSGEYSYFAGNIPVLCEENDGMEN